MFEFEQTDIFREWLLDQDENTQSAVVERIILAGLGLLGKLLKGTGGISEIALNTSPGYRLYYCREANAIYWLLVGGIKKTQKSDIERAMALHDELKRSGYGRAQQV